MNLITRYLTNNPCYKKNTKLAVKGLMLHSVGCAQPRAEVFINTYDKPTYTRACVHAFIDGNTGTVYQTLPWDVRGWHAGTKANDKYIGVEMCEPGTIKYTGGSKFTVNDLANARAVAKRTYDAAVELFAKLCNQYNLDPLQDGVILSHAEGYKRGIATGHADPEHLWNQLKLSYTMNTFRQDVKYAMKGILPVGAVTEPAPNTTTEKEVKVGSLVRVNKGARTYTGGTLSSFVYSRDHVVKSIVGDRVVITFNGTVIAAMHKKDLSVIR